jgi:hypothetical protein
VTVGGDAATEHTITVNADKTGMYMAFVDYTAPSAATYFWMHNAEIGEQYASLNYARSGSSYNAAMNTLSVYLKKGENTVTIGAKSAIQVNSVEFRLAYAGDFVSGVYFDGNTGVREGDSYRITAEADTNGDGKWSIEEALADGRAIKNSAAGDGFGDPPVRYNTFSRSQVLYYAVKLVVEKDGIYRLGLVAEQYSTNSAGGPQTTVILTNDATGTEAARINPVSRDQSAYTAAGLYSNVDGFGSVFMDHGFVTLKAGTYSVRVGCSGNICIGSLMLLSADHTHVFDGASYEGIAPTCETAGRKAGNACSICGMENPADQLSADPTAHSWTGESYDAVAPTCSAGGNKAGNKCAYCGIENPDDQLPADPTAHTLTGESYDAKDATCSATGLKAGNKCAHCGIVNPADVIAIDPEAHTYVDGVCECGATEVVPEAPAEPTTVKVNIGEYATAPGNGWKDATYYSTVVMDENITVTAEKTGNNGKYYENGNQWRMYQTDNGTFTVTAANGKTIKTVKITYASNNGGIVVYNGNKHATGSEITVNAETVTFSLGNTGTKTNGQVRITAIEVVYE